MDKVERHRALLNEIHDTYRRKNADYGDSFGKSIAEFGLTAAIVRMWDKLERAKQLTRDEAQVKDESLRDTLLDLANYAVMTVIEMNAGTDGKRYALRYKGLDGEAWTCLGLSRREADALASALDMLGLEFQVMEDGTCNT